MNLDRLSKGELERLKKAVKSNPGNYKAIIQGFLKEKDRQILSGLENKREKAVFKKLAFSEPEKRRIKIENLRGRPSQKYDVDKIRQSTAWGRAELPEIVFRKFSLTDGQIRVLHALIKRVDSQGNLEISGKELSAHALCARTVFYQHISKFEQLKILTCYRSRVRGRKRAEINLYKIAHGFLLKGQIKSEALSSHISITSDKSPLNILKPTVPTHHYYPVGLNGLHPYKPKNSISKTIIDMRKHKKNNDADIVKSFWQHLEKRYQLKDIFNFEKIDVHDGLMEVICDPFEILTKHQLGFLVEKFGLEKTFDALISAFIKVKTHSKIPIRKPLAYLIGTLIKSDAVPLISIEKIYHAVFSMEAGQQISYAKWG